jgi:hypothetical protein
MGKAKAELEGGRTKNPGLSGLIRLSSFCFLVFRQHSSTPPIHHPIPPSGGIRHPHNTSKAQFHFNST